MNETIKKLLAAIDEASEVKNINASQYIKDLSIAVANLKNAEE